MNTYTTSTLPRVRASGTTRVMNFTARWSKKRGKNVLQVKISEEEGFVSLTRFTSYSIYITVHLKMDLLHLGNSQKHCKTLHFLAHLTVCSAWKLKINPQLDQWKFTFMERACLLFGVPSSIGCWFAGSTVCSLSHVPDVSSHVLIDQLPHLLQIQSFPRTVWDYELWWHQRLKTHKRFERTTFLIRQCKTMCKLLDVNLFIK